MNAERKYQLLKALVDELCAEKDAQLPDDLDTNELWVAFRALVNARPAWPMNTQWLDMQDELLRGMIEEAGVRARRLSICASRSGAEASRLRLR